MKLIDKDTYKAIEKQMYNKARDIDCAMFNGMFGSMSKDFIIDCLLMFQNRDGGFGHQLESDNYNPDSTVYTTYEAFRLLFISGMDKSELTEDGLLMVNKAFNYLYNRNSLVSNKWVPVTEKNNQFAHAERFSYNEDNIKNFGYYPTASLFGFTLLYSDPNKPYYNKALKGARHAISDFLEFDNFSKEELLSFSILIGILEENKIEIDDLDKASVRLDKLALDMIQSDSNKWDLSISVLPLDIYAYYKPKDNKLNELIELNLDYLIETIKPHGLWESNLKWNNDYPEQTTALLKGMGLVTINNLYVLKKYKRIENVL